jgi:hypothetical protein
LVSAALVSSLAGPLVAFLSRKLVEEECRRAASTAPAPVFAISVSLFIYYSLNVIEYRITLK